MSSPPKTSSSGSAENWARVIEGAGQGAQNAMAGTSSLARSKVTAKEAKRRTLANLLSQAMKRDRNLFALKKEHGHETKEFQSNALQKMAHDFLKSSPKTGE